MKSYKYILFSFLAVMIAGCNDIKESAESVSFPEKEIVLTATREGLQPGTRSFRLDDGSVWWSPNEEVSVFYGAGSNGGSKFVSMNSAIAETVELQGSVQMAGSGKDFWAVYPYSEDNSCDGSSITTVIPDVQIGVEGNFSGDVFPAVAKSSSMSLAFWNICGGVKFFVSRSDVKSVTFKGNNNEPLAGKVKVTFGSDGTPVVQEVIDAKTEVTLVAPDGGFFKPGKYYYITLLPASLDRGITMVFKTETEKGELVSDKSQTIKRSIFGVLKNIDAKVSTWESTEVTPDYVDLGLPSGLKWATMNVGATKPEEYGDYFAWGETEPYYSSQDPLTWNDGKSSGYYWPSYKFELGTDHQGPFSKYVTNSSYGTVDNKTVLDPEDDAAHVNWGGSWRMPTDAEWTELRTKCTWTWTTQNGVKGRLVTGPNGKSIFLPAAGYRYDTRLGNAGSYGYFWSSSLYTGYPGNAYIVYFYSDGVGWDYYDRCSGFSIRPVYGEIVPVSSISIPETTTLPVGKSEIITATVLPADATYKTVTWSSSDESVATVDATGKVTAVATGKATITAYSADASKTATCEVTVVETAKPEAVDLGLPSGIKWATFNIGATKPEEYGEYFAWGELNPKSVYDVSTYNYFSNGEYKCTKYCPKYLAYYWNGQGEPDNKTVLDPEDDVAHVLLGDKWHIPTLEEKNELINNCSLTWTSNYNGTGVAGMIVTSKMTGFTDKSIFLPASGIRSGTSLNGVGTRCLYWSSSLDINTPHNAYGLSYYSPSNIFWDGATRSVGCSVRPVYGEPTISFTLTLNVNYLELIVGNSAYLSAVITPSNYCSESSVRWASRDDTIASVDQSGSIVALKDGSTVIDAYSSNGLSASCTIVVRTERFPEPEPVDFGLSVKWASFNLGASKPEEYGDYFAWGETEPYYIEGHSQDSPCSYWKYGKDSGYYWPSYKYANGDYQKLTKYCTRTSYWGGSGRPDGLTSFSQTDPPYMDDAAHTILGGEWHIPTKVEWDDLERYCDWEWTDDFNGTGTQGYIVTRSSYTDKFIFLPGAGLRVDLLLREENFGRYWTSSLSSDPKDAYQFSFWRNNNIGLALLDRSYGCSIRPVYFDSINPSSVTLNKTVSTLTAGDTQ